MNPVNQGIQSIRAFGVPRLLCQVDYSLKIRSGFYERTMPAGAVSSQNAGDFKPLPSGSRDMLFPYMEKDSLSILEHAGELLRKKFHPFYSSAYRTIDFEPPHPDLHWSKIKSRAGLDIKDIWEPSRFCWAPILCRASLLTNDPVYSDFFYDLVADFRKQNPANCGENWVSAQEAAIRIIMISFCAGVLSNPPNGTDVNLAQMIETHATRILPTRNYAIAQNNNHRLSEAAGLMTAACVLPNNPQSDQWFETGWQDFRSALNRQILPDGAYVQHSVNYHRLMLQLVLWVDILLKNKGLDWQPALAEKIRRSILWLDRHTDSQSGRICNYGHNDGALLFSFDGNYEDIKSTLQAASVVFMEKRLYEPGPWDELRTWLGCHRRTQSTSHPLFDNTYLSKNILRIDAGTEWGLLHTAAFNDRPAHADQLHVSLWKSGRCRTLDAGTYRYAGISPWNNGLKSAFVHNCLTIDGLEPMSDISRFLWLDWDQSRILEQTPNRVVAEHKGYQKYAIRHQRTLEKTRDEWIITDQVTPFKKANNSNHKFRLHWLLPDQPFEILREDDNWVFLSNEEKILFTSEDTDLILSVIRSGKKIYAVDDSYKPDGHTNLCGWYSPTYSERQSALSIILTTVSQIPFSIKTRWRFLYTDDR